MIHESYGAKKSAEQYMIAGQLWEFGSYIRERSAIVKQLCLTAFV